MAETSQRRYDIDIARAVAIFTVVLHHVPQYFVRYNLSYFPPNVADTFIAIVSYINIPLFMFVAGIVFGMQNRPSGTIGWWRFERKKFCRLFLPFLSVSIMQLAIKIGLGQFSILEVPNSLLAMVISPLSAPAPHLWFLYTLMSIFVIWPIFQKLTSSKMIPVFWALLIIMAVAPINKPVDKNGNGLFCLGNLVWYLPIFTLGYWYSISTMEKHKYHLPVIILTVILSIASFFICNFTDWPKGFAWQASYRCIHLAGHISCAIFFFELCGLLAKSTLLIGEGLKIIGFYSYDIYLLHVALIAHPLILIISKLHPDKVMTYVLFVVAVGITTTVPILIGKAIRRMPPLAFVILGVPLKKN